MRYEIIYLIYPTNMLTYITNLYDSYPVMTASVSYIIM